MNDDYPRERTGIHIWLISVIAAAFVIELVLLSPRGQMGQAFISQLVLTVGSLRSWHVWTILSYGLLHDYSNPFPILFTLCSLYYLGRELTPVLGATRFLTMFLTSLAVGALAWVAAHWQHGGEHIGATSAILGLFVILAGIYPDQQISFLLIPVSFRLRQILWVVLAFELLGLVLYEVIGAAAPLGLAPSAHLGGMLAGWVYFRFFHQGDNWDRAPMPLLRMPSWIRRESNPSAPAPAAKVSLKHRSGLRSEVDRILDKINSQGFGSLTHEEKRVLDEAKDLLSRH